jgi:hypothetical protein
MLQIASAFNAELQIALQDCIALFDFHMSSLTLLSCFGACQTNKNRVAVST